MPRKLTCNVIVTCNLIADQALKAAVKFHESCVYQITHVLVLYRSCMSLLLTLASMHFYRSLGHLSKEENMCQTGIDRIGQRVQSALGFRVGFTCQAWTSPVLLDSTLYHAVCT